MQENLKSKLQQTIMSILEANPTHESTIFLGRSDAVAFIFTLKKEKHSSEGHVHKWGESLIHDYLRQVTVTCDYLWLFVILEKPQICAGS